MAEEIWSSWEGVEDLWIELVSDDNKEDGGRKTRDRTVMMFTDPPGFPTMKRLNIRLEDADGKIVKFPLRLVSDTKYNWTKYGLDDKRRPMITGESLSGELPT